MMLHATKTSLRPLVGKFRRSLFDTRILSLLTTRTHITDCRTPFNNTDLRNCPKNETTTTTEEADLCRLEDRYKYHSWPSKEHAAFAFAQLASPGHAEIGLEEFCSTLQRIQLDFNLSRVELERVFDSLDTNQDGMLSLEEFKMGRTKSPFTKALIETLSGAGTLDANTSWKIPDHFDSSLDTAEVYQASLEAGFVGDNDSIRKSLDYSFHSNYTHERQRFQDHLIQSNVLLGGAGADRPWLVYTCGPMGAGKGWVLGWMSAHNILPLEQVSKIDPDAFKLRMPEWPLYVEQSMQAAGTQTHAESSYIAEIALRLAMTNGMNVWVDGSLRNWQWYQAELKQIRQRFPQYRIAIVAIDAPEERIAENIERRYQETGRHVSEDLRKASREGVEQGLRQLTHLVDLIAHVSNQEESEEDGEQQQQQPVLKSVSVVDRSGNWDLVRQLTATSRSAYKPRS